MRNTTWRGYQYLTAATIVLLLAGIVVIMLRGQTQEAITLSSTSSS